MGTPVGLDVVVAVHVAFEVLLLREALPTHSTRVQQLLQVHQLAVAVEAAGGGKGSTAVVALYSFGGSPPSVDSCNTVLDDCRVCRERGLP